MGDVQNLFRREHEAWLSSARATAYELLLSRPIITIEDVLKICLRPISNGRIIRTWTLAKGFEPKSYRQFKKRRLEQYA